MEYYPYTKAAIVGCFFCLYKLGESQFISEIVGESPIKSEKVRSTYYRCCTFVARIAKKIKFQSKSHNYESNKNRCYYQHRMCRNVGSFNLPQPRQI